MNMKMKENFRISFCKKSEKSGSHHVTEGLTLETKGLNRRSVSRLLIYKTSVYQ